MFHRVVAAAALCAALGVASINECELGYGPPECNKPSQKWCDKFLPYFEPDRCKEFPPGFLCGDDLEFRCVMCWAGNRAYCDDPSPTHLWGPGLREKVCKDGGSFSYLFIGRCEP